MAKDWSRDEVEVIVADYFAMLEAESAGETVNKAERNRRLQLQLGRSKGSIEFKHFNISAVLLNFCDLPYIDGYKPRGNYQKLLGQIVLERLTIEPDFFERIAAGPVMQPTVPASTDFTDLALLVEDPPEPIGAAGISPASVDSVGQAMSVRRIDFVRLDAENRRLGRQGEEWALEFERRRLHDDHRRPDFAKRVVWVSACEGDGVGYDIRSFNADDSPRLIEVKTTGLGKYFPFYVTPNELNVSQRESSSYHLYRVFRYGRGPRMYQLKGALSETCCLKAAQYSAQVGR